MHQSTCKKARRNLGAIVREGCQCILHLRPSLGAKVRAYLASLARRGRNVKQFRTDQTGVHLLDRGGSQPARRQSRISRL